MTTRYRNPRYSLERRANRRTGYPLATLAFYGPDDRRASKVVVGIVPSREIEEPTEYRKWFSDSLDLRTAPEVAEQILAFLDEWEVDRIVMVERIIGCPHEEGIDYPEGEKCPECPFWANRDRWTGERLD